MRAITRGMFLGAVEHDTFTLQPTGSASGRPPRLVGRYAAAQGSLVEVDVALDPIAQLGSLVGWAPGVRATSTEVTEALAALADSLEIAAIGDDARMRSGQVGDPTAPGAETLAPPSFRATVSLDEARFVVSNRAGPGHRVVVTAAYLRIDHIAVAWDALGSCDAREDALLLGDRILAADAHRPWEIRWLARYLSCRADATRRHAAGQDRDSGGRAAVEALLNRHR